MSDKYEFLYSIKMLGFEMNELSTYVEESTYCYELLTKKLNDLSRFVVSEDNNKQWQLWEGDTEIMKYSEKLRDASSNAICTIEKYHSLCALNNKTDLSEYMSTLCDSVSEQLEAFEFNKESKIIFIGSGAFPISALTIARQTDAEIMCLDIDLEAVETGKNMAELSGLETRVSFTNKTVSELSFITEATHVVIASLVKNKLEVLADLSPVISQNTKVIIRYGNGLKSLFNYPLYQDLSDEWNYINIEQSEHFYDTVILKKLVLNADERKKRKYAC
ncbi:nicotianamine synthase family protein [Planococcus sp. ISL-109]|uniref:nicotianamine synthase family protein n=1 Tax=Planococcus sp. ISL-109 TaxID=2819166 RepID=UPI001BE74F5A|nr:nicotianamine synthase family protein [Planococcus sp. ISL-109]MBT2583221.1 hypothetical protein [Planococcus sp. ISL-109]